MIESNFKNSISFYNSKENTFAILKKVIISAFGRVFISLIKNHAWRVKDVDILVFEISKFKVVPWIIKELASKHVILTLFEPRRHEFSIAGKPIHPILVLEYSLYMRS